ncbi:MAG: anti-sigma factor family protein [Planctomycetota bacterium]|jgi:hypothetical protein
MDVTPELISLYADGQATPEECAAVEAALRDDPQAAIELDELKVLEELFGAVEPETVSEDCLEKLYSLDQASYAAARAGEPAFERVELAPVRRIAWGGWAAAAAAVFLAVYGLLQLSHDPEVTLRDFARLTLDADGNVVKTERLEAVTKKSGDAIAAGPQQRITYRDPLGARVVLMPNSSVEIGDPRKGDLLELQEGTALLTVYDSAEPRAVHAGGYVVRSHGANYGVRVIGRELRGAGAAKGTAPKVTVAVRTGSCEVGENGARQQVDASWCVTLRRGKPAERARIWESPLYAQLLEGRGHEIIAGFFSTEAGVRQILPYEWDREGPGEFSMLVSAHEAAAVAQWLIAEVELQKPTALELIRTRPLRGGERAAVQASVATPVVPAGRHVVAIPLDALDAPETVVTDVEVPVARSYLVELRLRTKTDKSPLKIKVSLWSARPPAGTSEVVR